VGIKDQDMSGLKVAVPAWQGRVSPVFDVAEQVVLVDLDESDDGSRHTESLGSTGPHERARRLAELGVNVLVCGAISWPLEALVAASGIRVIPLVCGEVAEVVRAFRDGKLEDQRFAMPGCCQEKRYARHRRRRGCGGSATGDIS
jgi:predicted Fe-Mo cluster-binding NifX family protein